MNNDQFFNMMMTQRSNSLFQNDVKSEHASHENVFVNFLNNKYKESPDIKQQYKDCQASPMIAGPKSNKFEPYILKPSNQITQIQNGAKVDYVNNNADNNIKNSISSVFMTGNSQQQFSEVQYSKLSSDLNQLIKGKAVQNNFKQNPNLNNISNTNSNNNLNNNYRTSNLRESSKEFKFSDINIENLNDNELKLFSNVPSTLWDSLEDNHNLLNNKRNKTEASNKTKYKECSIKAKESKEKIKKTDSLSNLKEHQAIPMNFQVKNQNFKLEVNDSNELNDDKFNIFNDENNMKEFFPQEYLNDRRGSLNNLHPFIYKMNKKDSVDYFNNINQQNYLKFPPKASFNNSELRDSIMYQDLEKSETLNLQENSATEDKEDTNGDPDRMDTLKGCGLSREMKMLKNRISAKKCREKKKKEREVMEDENEKLKKEVESLKNEMAFYNLTSKMKTVSYYMTNIVNCNFYLL